MEKTEIMALGLTLMEIRDKRLYLETHTSFEEFCQKVFGLGLSEAGSCIEAAQTISREGQK